ncbi:hypothetical protein C8Q77DRAFT_1157882 [Trametes polyzona]|nr:hypothetical protein C8Q77DRAFT_1157882 [Trametes polyzona]
MAGRVLTLSIVLPPSPVFEGCLAVLAITGIIATATLLHYVYTLYFARKVVAKAIADPVPEPKQPSKPSTPRRRQKARASPPPENHPLPAHSQPTPSAPAQPTPASPAQPTVTGRPINHALMRTRTISTQLINNSTRPIVNAHRALKGQVASVSREMLRPRRMKVSRPPTVEPPIPGSPSGSSEGEASSSGQSSSSSSSASPPSSTNRRTAADSSDTAGSSSSADVSRAPSPDDDDSSPFSPANASPRTRTQRSRRTSDMSSSAPSTPERPRRSANRTPDGKGSGRRKAPREGGEPIRYARPACPENSLPGVIFEQRYENPFKSMFKGSTRANGDASESKETNLRESFSFMKSSPSFRRLFNSSGSSGGETESSEGETSGSDRSRRSSVSSSTRPSISSASEVASVRGSADIAPSATAGSLSKS